MANNYGDVYNIEGWGDPYFAVNEDGHLCVRINGRDTPPEQEIDVLSAIEQATAADDKGRKLQFPMILRFPDVLRHRIESLHTAFANAIKYTGYGSVYQGVFPVKVNQHKAVVQDMVQFGYDHSYGLEHSCRNSGSSGSRNGIGERGSTGQRTRIDRGYTSLVRQAGSWIAIHFGLDR